MIVGVPRESFPGERRVALVPAVIPMLAKAGLEVVIETRRRPGSRLSRRRYVNKGAKIVASRAEVFRTADIVLQVLSHGSNDQTGKADLPLLRPKQALIGFLRPLGDRQTVQEIAATGVTSFSVELMPRTTRAQSMDALSSMGTICGYKAVLIAADTLPKIFPMLTTAAGTITPARVLIIGVRCCRTAGHCYRAPVGSSRLRLRFAARRERTGAEPGRALCGTADRGAGCAGCRRLRQGAGRIVLPEAARACSARSSRRATLLSPPPWFPARSRRYW